MFEMHVYILGTWVYARVAVERLDPDGVYFGGRIESKDESTQWKSLDLI
jgi:RNA polymerase II C-terminal domain phosphatase-like 3/4